jgi:hypothetical protein
MENQSVMPILGLRLNRGKGGEIGGYFLQCVDQMLIENALSFAGSGRRKHLLKR